MAKRRINKKGRKYRRSKKLAKRGYTTRIHKDLGFIAPRTIVRLKYSDQENITVPVSSFGDVTYRLNSIFQPNYIGGHQPYGRDQLAALYNRYRVFATKWVVVIAPTNDVLYASTCPVNGNVTFAQYTLIAENPRAMTKTTSIGSTPLVLKGKIYLPRLGGDYRMEYRTDDRFSAVMTANPTERMDLHVGLNNPSSTVAVNCRFFITLMYYCECYDPFVQNQS